MNLLGHSWTLIVGGDGEIRGFRAGENRIVSGVRMDDREVEVVPASQLQGAVDDLAKIGHAFLAYEHAPFADRGEYRAELLAVLREVVNRHAGGQ